MIFKRREKPPLLPRLREILYPRKGLLRGFEYIRKRMHRLPDNPHRIALGFACGAFVSFSPFFGFHFFLAAGLAWLVRGNVMASLFGTAIGNPLTFPFISAIALWLGRWLMGEHSSESEFEAVTHAFAEAMNSIWGTTKSWFGYGPSMADGLRDFFHDLFLPYLIGGVLPGLICGAICYWLIGPVVAAYQERRRNRLAKRAGKWRQAMLDEQGAYMSRDRKEGDNA